MYFLCFLGERVGLRAVLRSGFALLLPELVALVSSTDQGVMFPVAAGRRLSLGLVAPVGSAA